MAAIKRTRLCVIGAFIVIVTVLYITLVHNGGSGKEKILILNNDIHKETWIPSSYAVNTSTASPAPNTTTSTSAHSTTPQSISSSSCTVSSDDNLILDKDRHIIIIGAMSFIGSRLAVYLHDKGYHVLAVEDLECVDNDELKWYRWSHLVKARIPVQVIMLTRKDKLMSLLNAHSPQAIIYVPTKVNGMERIDHQINSVLRNYVSLLMNLKKGTPKQFMLISTGIDKGWGRLYETLLTSLYPNDKSSIISVHNVHGPWQETTDSATGWYIDDVGSIVLKALTNSHQLLWDMDHCHSFINNKGQTLLSLNSNSVSNTMAWLNEYNEYRLNGRPRNVTLGAYLVSLSPGSLYGVFPVSNRARYFFEWFRTAKNHELSIVLFHDTMTNDFQSRLKSVYSKIETIHVSPVNRIIINDQRFYFIYDYLLKHDDINMAITTDIRDVEFLRNPMDTMSLLGHQHIYAGLDIPYYLTLGSHGQTNNFKTCFPSYPNKEVFGTYRFFNNGVLGGTRAMLLTLLVHLVSHIDVSIHYGNWCCDMSTVQYLLHTKFAKNVFVGYPFNSAFFTQTPGPKGLTVRHKPDRQ